MKKTLSIFVVLVVVVAIYFVFLTDTKKVTNYPSTGTTIVAFGDSLVAGVGATKGNDFVSVLSDKVGFPIVNLGKSGDTTEMALDRLDSVLAEDPKVVLLLVGGNDYLRRVPKAETFSNLSTIIESIHQSGSVVILLGVQGGVLKDGYKDDFESLAEEYGTAYVPNVLDGLIGQPDLMSDSIHPNDAGHKIMAEKIFPVLRDLLE